jgi:hypothetical protein
MLFQHRRAIDRAMQSRGYPRRSCFVAGEILELFQKFRSRGRELLVGDKPRIVQCSELPHSAGGIRLDSVPAITDEPYDNVDDERQNQEIDWKRPSVVDDNVTMIASCH